MDKQRTITDLAEDAMDEVDYKGRINFLVAGLMFADPDIDKEQAEKIILDSNATLKKDNLEFVSSNGNIYTYNYKVDDSTAIVSYEVDIEKETYTVVIGQLTKSA